MPSDKLSRTQQKQDEDCGPKRGWKEVQQAMEGELDLQREACNSKLRSDHTGGSRTSSSQKCAQHAGASSTMQSAGEPSSPSPSALWTTPTQTLALPLFRDAPPSPLRMARHLLAAVAHDDAERPLQRARVERVELQMATRACALKTLRAAHHFSPQTPHVGAKREREALSFGGGRKQTHGRALSLSTRARRAACASCVLSEDRFE
eukprot:20285-Pleurochrysis_carterae.AAC.1